MKPFAERSACVCAEESKDTFITEITLSKLLRLLERMDLRVSQLTIFSSLQVDDHAISLGVLPSEMRESLAQLRLFSHVTINDITSVIIVLLKISLHKVLNSVKVRSGIHILSHFVDVAVHESKNLWRL